MPPLTAEHATLVLDHFVGNPSVPAAVVDALCAKLPLPSNPTPRLRRALLLRILAADPVSESSLQTIQALASLPASASASHIGVAAFLAASAPDFDAAARELFGRPNGRAVQEGGPPALAVASQVVTATADQFEAAIGNSSYQTILRGLWGNRTAAEERVRDLLAAEWAAIGPSKLEAAAERIVGDGAVETWRAADEATRAKLRILAGEEKTREILGRLGEPTSNANPISTPAVENDLRRVVEDPLPAAKAVADEVLPARMDKGVSLNAEQARVQPATCGAAGPSTLNDKDKGPSRGKPYNIMDRNPTARTSQWEESPGVEGSESSLRRPRLLPRSPLPPPVNKSKHRKPLKKWSPKKFSLVEEETLRKAVHEYGTGNWKDILEKNRDVFIGRTTVNLKDKWRNMTKI